MNFADLWSRSQPIEGWLTEAQGRSLFDAAATVKDGDAIVEIGSHHGRSTLVLASAKRPGVSLIAVDPFDDERWGGGRDAIDIFESNLRRAGVDREVTLLRSYAADAGKAWAGGPVGMLFVDGAHDYPTVAADLAAWLPHLSPNATVLMHDAYSSPGVTAAAFRAMFGSPNFIYQGSSRSLARFQRAPGYAMPRRSLSAARMVMRLSWLARNLAIKLALRRGWVSVSGWLGHPAATCPY